MTQEIARDLESGLWAETNPFRCPCKGRGWFLSDFDSYHRCPIHGNGVPHPCDDEGTETFDAAEHAVRVARTAFKTFYTRANKVRAMTPVEFKSCCAAERLIRNGQDNVRSWVNAAECLCTRLEIIAREERACANGYSCALEENFAWEATWERAGGF